MNRRSPWQFVLFGALVLAVGFVFFEHGVFNVKSLEAHVSGAGALGPLLYIASYAAATVLFLPESVVTLTGGVLFGPIRGAIYSLTGAMGGATIAFLIARYLASDWVHRRAHGWSKQLIDGVEKEGWRFVAFVRLIPLFPFSLVNYALGITRIQFISYIAASFLFMLPGTFAYTYLGYAGREAVDGTQGLIEKGLFALGSLSIVAFLPSLIRRLRASPGAPIRQVTSVILKERLDQQDDIVVLDVGTAADYSGKLGHVPGSINIPLGELGKRLAELDAQRGRPIAVIGSTRQMSDKAAELLQRSRFPQIWLVADGVAGWTANGFNTVRSDPNHPDAGSVTTTPQHLGR